MSSQCNKKASAINGASVVDKTPTPVDAGADEALTALVRSVVFQVVLVLSVVVVMGLGVVMVMSRSPMIRRSIRYVVAGLSLATCITGASSRSSISKIPEKKTIRFSNTVVSK